MSSAGTWVDSMGHFSTNTSACILANLTGDTCFLTGRKPGMVCSYYCCCKLLLGNSWEGRQVDVGFVTHKGNSQLSNFRASPGGGGVSPNKYPFLPVCVPSAQKEPPGQPCPPRCFGLRSTPRATLRMRDAIMCVPRQQGSCLSDSAAR